MYLDLDLDLELAVPEQKYLKNWLASKAAWRPKREPRPALSPKYLSGRSFRQAPIKG